MVTPFLSLSRPESFAIVVATRQTPSRRPSAGCPGCGLTTTGRCVQVDVPTQSSASPTDRCCIGRPSRRCRRSREIENTEVVGTSRPPRPAVQIPITTSASCFPISACNRAIPSTPSGSRPCSASVRPGPSARDHDDPEFKRLLQTATSAARLAASCSPLPAVSVRKNCQQSMWQCFSDTDIPSAIPFCPADRQGTIIFQDSKSNRKSTHLPAATGHESAAWPDPLALDRDSGGGVGRAATRQRRPTKAWTDDEEADPGCGPR